MIMLKDARVLDLAVDELCTWLEKYKMAQVKETRACAI